MGLVHNASHDCDTISHGLAQMATSLSPIGDHCEQIEISAEDIVTGHKLPVLPDFMISKLGNTVDREIFVVKKSLW